jgi:hypothetical protein
MFSAIQVTLRGHFISKGVYGGTVGIWWHGWYMVAQLVYGGTVGSASVQ